MNRISKGILNIQKQNYEKAVRVESAKQLETIKIELQRFNWLVCCDLWSAILVLCIKTHSCIRKYST